VAQNSPDLNPLDYHVWDAMLKSAINSSRSKTTDELKVALETMVRAVKRTRRWRTTPGAWLPTWLWAVAANSGHFEHLQ